MASNASCNLKKKKKINAYFEKLKEDEEQEKSWYAYWLFRIRYCDFDCTLPDTRVLSFTVI